MLTLFAVVAAFRWIRSLGAFGIILMALVDNSFVPTPGSVDLLTVFFAARSRDIYYEREMLARFPASRAQFLVNDSAPAPGTLWKQPDLARTLQLISDSGPSVFYRGQIADLIVAEMKRGGGLITKEDLARYDV